MKTEIEGMPGAILADRERRVQPPSSAFRTFVKPRFGAGDTGVVTAMKRALHRHVADAASGPSTACPE
jgi:hypothetical protein